ncbi:hypothetical protein M0R45_001073 [Rubus argutus]|uniref:Uncharacterized protein n=1 Tax=Rubus argutus TaxID=59490 RepID=A0AAW1VIG2_RUBAR
MMSEWGGGDNFVDDPRHRSRSISSEIDRPYSLEDDDDDDDEEDKSLDMLVRVVQNVFKKVSKLARRTVPNLHPHQGGEFLKEAKPFIEDRVQSLEEKKELLRNCSPTTLIGEEKEFFAKMVVDVVIAIGDDDHLNMIRIYKLGKILAWLI